MTISKKKLRRRRDRLQVRAEFLQRRIDNREDDALRGDRMRCITYDIAEISALQTAIELFDARLADLDDSDLIDEDPPADIDEQLREHLAEVASMSGELRSLVGAAERTLLDLTAALGKADQYRHVVVTAAQMLIDGEDALSYLEDAAGNLGAHGREVLHG